MTSSPESRVPGWRGVCLVIITYVYFLIFAQFAFLQRLAELGIASQKSTDFHLKLVMGAMAAAGIFLSLAAPRIEFFPSPATRLRTALTACGVAALLAVSPLTLATAILIAVLIGASLGLLTVTLVTHLRDYLGTARPLLGVAFGTGLGYFVCNFPPLFTASARTQSLVAAILCLLGMLLVPRDRAQNDVPLLRTTLPFARVLVGFAALIWLDSAAFYIIQNTPTLKAGTWQGDAHLWINGALHLLAAVAAAYLLRRRGLATILIAAFGVLASACLLLHQAHSIPLASVLYPVGVSLYSVALVAYPSLLAPASTVAERGRQAGWIYAIAGWLGSAMGIGMGQNLGYVPLTFVLFAGVVILFDSALTLLRTRRTEVFATIAFLVAAFVVSKTLPSTRRATPPQSAAELGQRVYTAEGCINCHSQYVRPGTSDVLNWGPTQTIEELRRAHPPLIGNRRQGPDLSEVGSRRSQLWLRAHFLHPSEVSHGSFMPSFAYLFESSDRGDHLIAYLTTLQTGGVTKHRLAEQAWQPTTTPAADPTRGATLYNQHCATCHNADGITRNRWLTHFKRLPPNLATGPYHWLPASGAAAPRMTRLEQIIKFGIPGTNMPGHEYLPDEDIVQLSRWLNDLNTLATPGEKP